jgi:hypothetical protein
MFEKLYREMFAKDSYRKFYHVSASSGEALEYIENYIPLGAVNKWFLVPENKK